MATGDDNGGHPEKFILNDAVTLAENQKLRHYRDYLATYNRNYDSSETC